MRTIRLSSCSPPWADRGFRHRKETHLAPPVWEDVLLGTHPPGDAMTENAGSAERRPDESQPAGQQGRYGPPMPPVDANWQRAAAQPGVIPLRPLGVGDILHGAISTIRRHPGLMLGVTAVVATVTQLVALAATYPLLADVSRIGAGETLSASEAFDVFGKGMAIAGIAALLAIISRVFLSGFITLLVGTAVIGRSQTFRDLWRRVGPRMGALLGLTLVYPAAIIPSVLVIVLLALVVPPVAVIAAIAVVVVGIWLGVLFSLATPALVLEDVGVWRAFGRSLQLVRGSWWRILGITLLALIIASIAAVIIALPFDLLGGGYSMTPTEQVDLSAGALVLTTIGGIVAATITEPFVVAVTALLYTDQRIRREGLAAELAASAGTAHPDIPPPPGRG